jgi:hypothetical protein
MSRYQAPELSGDPKAGTFYTDPRDGGLVLMWNAAASRWDNSGWIPWTAAWGIASALWASNEPHVLYRSGYFDGPNTERVVQRIDRFDSQ